MTKHRTSPACRLPAVTAAGLAITVGLTACGGAGRATGGPTPAPPHQQAVLASSAAPGAQPTITTVGTGTVTGAPDTLTIGIGVSTTALHAADALSQNNTIAAKVQQALANDGVAASDIQTTGLSLQQSYPQGSGYEVFDEVTATVHDLGNAGKIIDNALAPAGDAGRLQMVSFSMSSKDPFLSKARQAAVASARTDADQLATAAGRQLGGLVSMTEQSSQAYPMFAGPMAAGSASAAAAPPVPVQPGTQQVTVSVTTVWATA